MILVPARSVQVGKIYFTRIQRQIGLVEIIKTQRNRFIVREVNGKKLPKLRTMKDFFCS